MSEQATASGFTYHECPDCGFDAITQANGRSHCCPICAEDNGRDVSMRSRPARDDDAVEGRDARAEAAEHA